MSKLGNKIYKSVGKLGNKFQSISTKIGDKTNSIIKKMSDMKNQAIDLNNRAIELGNKAIQQSGSFTNGLRKSTGVINAITNGLSDVVRSDVPLVGSALKII